MPEQSRAALEAIDKAVAACNRDLMSDEELKEITREVNRLAEQDQ